MTADPFVMALMKECGAITVGIRTGDESLLMPDESFDRGVQATVFEPTKRKKRRRKTPVLVGDKRRALMKYKHGEGNGQSV